MSLHRREHRQPSTKHRRNNTTGNRIRNREHERDLHILPRLYPRLDNSHCMYPPAADNNSHYRFDTTTSTTAKEVEEEVIQSDNPDKPILERPHRLDRRL